MEELSNHLARHHGVVSREQARSLGVSDSSLRRKVGSGVLVRAYPSVYRAASAPRTWHSKALAAAWSAKGIISHRSAAALWGLDGYPFALTEVTIPYERSVRLPGVAVRRSKQFEFVDDCVIDAIPATGIARTVLDLAAVVGPRRLNSTIDCVLRRGLLDWPDLYSVLVRHSARGRNGCGKLRKVLDVRYGETRIPDSTWNRNVGLLLRDSGVGEPKYEYEIYGQRGDFIARVDLAYPRERVAIELDSVRWHFNRASFVADPRRKNKLLLEGWRVLTFTWSDYVDTPKALTSAVKTALLTEI